MAWNLRKPGMIIDVFLGTNCQIVKRQYHDLKTWNGSSFLKPGTEVGVFPRNKMLNLGTEAQYHTSKIASDLLKPGTEVAWNKLKFRKGSIVLLKIA